MTVDGISDAWNSYYYNGDNRESPSTGEACLSVRAQSRDPSSIMTMCWAKRARVDPEIEIDIHDPRFNFSATGAATPASSWRTRPAGLMIPAPTDLVFSGVCVSSADNRRLSFTERQARANVHRRQCGIRLDSGRRHKTQQYS